MTTEEKAKAYDKALEKVREYYKGLAGCRTKEKLESIFPELKESEDERIRKSIIHLIQVGGYMEPEDKEKAIAYLEKQKDLPTDEEMKATLRMEYEKGRADAIAEMSSAEWSEEDEKMLKLCESRILGTGTYVPNTTGLYNMVSWLKSLRPQPHWKPSEEQMQALCSKLPIVKGCGDKVQNRLESLYDDLKKLL